MRSNVAFEIPDQLIVAVADGGGRGGIFVEAFRKSPCVKKIYCFPGRDGWRSGPDDERVQCFLKIKAEQAREIVDKCKDLGVNLILAGQEAFLAAGGADMAREAGIAVVGCGRMEAQLETSKIYAKRFFRDNEIPTADFDEANNPEEARLIVRYKFLIQKVKKIVLKGDGLAEGKGVIIADSLEKAEEGICDLMEEGGRIKKVYPNAGNKLVIEEYLGGPKSRETSATFFTDGDHLVRMLDGVDHKQRFDGDEGDMTGGMGLIAPDPKQDASIDEQIWWIAQRIVERSKFQGILYLGLMVVDGKVYVLEVNVRFGAPEAQGIIPLLASDFAELCWTTATGQLSTIEVKWLEGKVSACITLVEGIYPAQITAEHKGKPISGLAQAAEHDVIVVHAGTRLENGVYVTDGGRVIDIIAVRDDLATALRDAYAVVDIIKWDGVDCRRDVGRKALTAA